MKPFLAAHGALTWLRSRVTPASERGATSVEYGIVAVLIAAVIVVAVLFLGQATNHNLDCSGRTIAAQSAPIC